MGSMASLSNLEDMTPPIVMKAKMLALTIMATNSSKHRLLFHFGFNPR